MEETMKHEDKMLTIGATFIGVMLALMLIAEFGDGIKAALS